MANYVLKLYITGHSSSSRVALRNISSICDANFSGDYDLEVIDILQNPQLAEDNKIIATPTLVKEQPSPLRKIIGDLSDREKVLSGLGFVKIKQDTFTNIGSNPNKG
ncbi:MAG: hypothetical protein MI863_13315 [Desulfobacterales bacterium]|nr:hypothetical protein [Desulfobacterales bacterium]